MAEKYQPLTDDKKGKNIEMQKFPAAPEHDPLQIPPNFQIAERHREATRITDANGSEFSIFSSTDKLSYIAPAFPLFFQFRKFCLIIGITILLGSGIHNMIQNYQGDACSGALEQTTTSAFELPADFVYTNDAQDQIIQLFSIKGDDVKSGVQSGVKTGVARLKNEFDFLIPRDRNENRAQAHMDQCQNTTINVLSGVNLLNNNCGLDQAENFNFFTIGLLILLLQILRYVQKQTAQLSDERAITSSDYTARVKNIPSFNKTVDIDEQIKNFFVNFPIDKANPTRRLNVQKVSVCYDVDEKVTVVKKITEASKSRAKLQARKRNGEANLDNQIQQLDQQIEQLRARRDAINQGFREGVGVAKDFSSGEAYVTFETQQDLQDVLRAFRISSFRRFIEWFKSGSIYKINGSILKLQQAPEPTDVFWENAGASGVKKFTLTVIATALIVVFLLIGFIGVWAIQKQRVALIDDLNTKGSNAKLEQYISTADQLKGISIASVILIIVVNGIINAVTKFFTKWEVFSTYTEFQSTYAMRIALAQFFNYSVVTFLVYIAFDNIAGPGGLIYTATWIFIIDAVYTWGLTLFNPTYIKHVLRRWKTSRSKDPIMTQEELNEIYELPPFDFSAKYAAVTKTLLSAAFFAPLIPAVTIIAIITIAVDYLFDKYVVVNRCSRGRSFGPELSYDFIEVLEYCLVFFSIGNFLFNVYILGESISEGTITLIGLVIGLVNAFLPMASINESIFPGRAEILTNDLYSVKNYRFPEDYDRANPATAEIAQAHYERNRKQNA